MWLLWLWDTKARLYASLPGLETGQILWEIRTGLHFEPLQTITLATLSLHGCLGVPHRLPGAGDVQEDGVRHARHAKAVSAHVLVPDGDQAVHPVLLELLGHLLGPLLVELHRVQVASGGDGAQYGVGEGAAARPCGGREGKEAFRRRGGDSGEHSTQWKLCSRLVDSHMVEDPPSSTWSTSMEKPTSRLNLCALCWPEENLSPRIVLTSCQRH